MTSLERVCETLVASGTEGALAFVTVDGRDEETAAGGLSPGERVRAGSVTKTAVAALALLLVEEGKLRLDDPVDAWVSGPGGITVRDLLRHTSGLPDYAANPAFLDRFLDDPGATWGTEELLELAGPTSKQPGSFAYSNTNYVVAGMVVEAISGAPLARLLADRLLQPLSIHDAELTGSGGAAAGGLVAPAAGLARLLRGLLSGEVLAPGSVAEMLTTVPGDGVEFTRYGLGIAEMDSFMGLVASPCGAAWGHLGFLPGCTCAVLSTRDGRRQAVLMTTGMVPEAFGTAMWDVFCEAAPAVPDTITQS